MELLTELFPLKSAMLAIGCVSAVAMLFAIGRAGARDWDHSCLSPFGRHEADGWSKRGEGSARKDD